MNRTARILLVIVAGALASLAFVGCTPEQPAAEPEDATEPATAVEPAIAVEPATEIEPADSAEPDDSAAEPADSTNVEADDDSAATDADAAPETSAIDALGTELEAGRTFLAENGKRPAVITTESGLQYEVLASGDGPSPSLTDTVTAHYHGTLIDGQVFDSSVVRGDPLVIPVNRVIPGWTEALTRMRVGDKWKLYIPSELAYGDRDPDGDGIIGADETLIFEVELLAVQNA